MSQFRLFSRPARAALMIYASLLAGAASLSVAAPAAAQNLLSGQNIGIVGGALAGGVAGNQLGGKNKMLGTAAGVVGGGVVGGVVGNMVDKRPTGSIVNGRNIGIAAGAVAGGVAGNKLGGKNKVLGTAAGVVGGGLVGGVIGNALDKKKR